MRSHRLAARVSVIGALALATVGLAACQPTPGPTESPAASEQPTPSAAPSGQPSTAPTSPAPSTSATPTPTPTPTAGAGGLPADCGQAYSAQMQDWLYDAFGQLNPAEASQVPSSKVVDLLDVIQGAPNLNCYWTPPGETALVSNAAIVPAQHEQFVRDVLTQNFPGCDATGDTVDCERQGEQQQGVIEFERVVLRGDLMLTTYAMNADEALVDEAVADMLAHLPG
ncbi:hypothetical protein ACH0AH_12170 [Microbacterium paludicola]|uniref:hypothetical protein n=1 Tax=Microbacterium paludicola TaxID=300019 RepID=UPI003879767D